MVHNDLLDVQIIDFASHCHVYDAEDVSYKLIDREMDEPVYKDIDAHRRRTQEAGIDGAVISQPHLLDTHDADKMTKTNDAIWAAIEDIDNYYALASLPIAAGGDVAAAEFERCLDIGFSGAVVGTVSDGIELHEPAFEPVFEVADRTEAPVLVHPILWDSIGSEMLDDAWRLDAVLGRDVGLIASLCKIIHTGVLDRYRDMILIYHHFGGNIVSNLGRFHNQFRKRPPAVWESPEPVKTFGEFKAQIEDRIYIDTSGYDGYRTVFRTALAELPTSQILFGTDFPWEERTPADLNTMIRGVAEEVSRADARRIFSQNALDLLVNIE